MSWRTLAGPALFALLGTTAAAEPFSFGAFGDTPYFAFEEVRLEKLIPEMNARPLVFVLHVGDIKSSHDHCDDRIYQRRKRLFDTIKHPFLITPGDNDWTDCHRKSSGEFDPIDRLHHFREVFYRDEPAIAVEHQSAQPQFVEYVENLRFVREGVLFMTVHVIGSNNNRGRTDEADEEYAKRNAADLHWLHASFALARERNLRGVVLAWHADAHLESSAGRQTRSGFGDVIAALREETKAFGRPVLLIHGDSHTYLFDHPLRDLETGKPLANFTRLEVFGAPTAGWIKVTVDPDGDPMFSVVPHK
jgi:hypothetical protein